MPEKLIIGLFLPKQCEVIAKKIEGEADLIVYPEAHDGWKNREKWKKHSKDIDTPIIVGLEDERGAQLGYFYNPKNGSSYTYIKHSTAAYIAFQDVNWSPENNLKVIELKGFKIGITICHDMYLSLLMRYLTKVGAQILINPSDSRVKRKKWATILRARAIENRAFTFCTLHDFGSRGNQGHVFGFSPSGEGVEFMNLANRKTYTSFETTSENVYITEIRKEEIEMSRRSPYPPLFRVNRIEIPIASPRKTKTVLVCKISGKHLDGEYDSSKFSFDFQKDPVFYSCGTEKIGVIPIKEEEVLKPEKIFAKISSVFNVCKDAKLVFWNYWEHLKEEEYSKRVIPIILSRVIEWCSPFIISISTPSRVEGFEIANSSKAVRRVNTFNNSLSFEMSRAWGIRSAFKMCKVKDFSMYEEKNFAKFRTILSRIGSHQTY